MKVIWFNLFYDNVFSNILYYTVGCDNKTIVYICSGKSLLLTDNTWKYNTIFNNIYI